MHKLHELKDMIVEHLEEYADKGIKSVSDLEEIDALAHAGKNIGKLIQMCEEDEDGSSFRRGRMMYRRDRMGRYAREGHEDGYAEASRDMLTMLDGMLRESKDDRERKTIREIMDELKVR